MRTAPLRRPRRFGRGFTLVESLVVLSICGLLLSAGVASFRERLERARLRTAAESLVETLQYARLRAGLEGRARQVHVAAGPSWCWSVSDRASCGCGAPATCGESITRSADHPGVMLDRPAAFRFTPDGGLAGSTSAQAELHNTNGDRLRIRVTPLGRAYLCVPDGARDAAVSAC